LDEYEKRRNAEWQQEAWSMSMLVGVQLELRHVMWVFHGISQFCIVFTFSTGLVIKITNDLL